MVAWQKLNPAMSTSLRISSKHWRNQKESQVVWVTTRSSTIFRRGRGFDFSPSHWGWQTYSKELCSSPFTNFCGNRPENTESPHAHDSTPQSDSESVSLQVRVPTTLRERGRDFPIRQTNNEGLKIQRSKYGRISRRYFQIEEEILLCNPLDVEEPISFQEAVNLPNHKEWMDAMKEWDGLNGKKHGLETCWPSTPM